MSAALPAPEPGGPEPVNAGDAVESAPPLDRQGYSLLSLVELSRMLWDTHDLHDAAQRLLLNLMGQIGTRHAALWLSSESTRPVLIRCHGMEASLARALGAACWGEMGARFEGDGTPMPPADVRAGFSDATRSLARQARVALFAPLCVDDAPMGLVALGLPAGADSFSPLQVEVLEASLAVAGLAMRSSHMQSLAMENGRKLRRANETLLELDRMKTEFLEHVNHEMRTPLAVSQGCLECLADPAIPAADRATLLEAAIQSNVEMMRLIERVLTLSESSGGSLTVQVAETDLTQFMDAYFAERRPGISAGLRDLIYARRVVPRPVRIDPARLRQVLDELVDNAVKFSAPGTRIWLNVAEAVEQGVPGTRISVADEGVGIPAARLPELFQSFRQMDGSRTRTVGGLGIGLAVARQLTEAMGGRITVEGGDASGPVFSIWVPAA
ncbi:MAG TPA: HAMP domain-containing sensor histidine kinase [Candidatus Eisenbacteria bacterium]|nr:HAMP domain-containing sensor histidine kinase [Candidatus Eisenbacteria bacterium]